MSIIIELLYVFFNSEIQVSTDAITHVRMALSSVENGINFYPNKLWIYYLYSSTPGWINHIIWILKLDLGIKGALYLNVLFNLGIGVLLYKITSKIISERIANIALIIFSLYPTWIISPRILNSEIPYIFYMMLGLWLIMKKEWYYILCSGVCIAMANWIRPFLPILFIFSILILYLNYKKKWKPYVYFLSGLIFSILTIGTITYMHIGHFEYQSSTQGINMLMCAWDGANGDFTHQMCEQGQIGYIENLNNVPYWEKNEFWLHQAVMWIINNPIKWISLIPYRIITLFWSDTFYFISYDNTCKVTKIISDFPFLTPYGWLFIINHLFYYAILITALLGIFQAIKNKHFIINIIFSFLFLSTCATILAPGINRYHMVMMPFIIIISAFYLNKKIYKHDS